MSGKRIQSGRALQSEFTTAACAATGQSAEVVGVIAAAIVEYLQSKYPAGKLYIPPKGRMIDIEKVFADYLARVPKSKICQRHFLSPRTLNRLVDEAIESGRIVDGEKRN